MSLSSGSVRRPVTVTMAVLAVSVFGVIAARRLPVELLPNLAYPSLTIQTNYPDAAPVSVEQFVSRPIEEAVGVIPGVRDLRSVSRAGRSEVVLEFDWSQDMDLAALEVREKLGLVELPREAERPRVLRFDPSLEPVARLALSGDRPLDELHDLAERWIKPRLEAVDGIAAAKVRGGLQAEVQVQANEDRLAALGMTLGDLGRALEQENVNLPGGVLRDWGAVYLIRTLHEFSSLKQLGRTIVRETRDGRVRLEDVAEVVQGHQEREQITLLQGREVVELALHREGSANTMRVSDDLRAELTRLREKLPQDLRLIVLSDQSRYIAAAVEQVWSAALLGGLLAILVVYFFLRDPLSTLTIALTIPVSVVATFLPMQQAGVTLNIMSLGGLALGVGMLVDNAIVVLEAIDRRRGLGEPRAQAAARGAEDVAGAVTAATLTTVSVFLPIVFVTGVAGQLFNDLAVTVCFSLLASLLASLTLIPALAAFDPAGMVRRARETLFRWDQEGEGAGTEEREETDPDLDSDPDPDPDPEHESRYPEGTIRIGGMALEPLGATPVARGLTWLLLPVRLLVVGVALVGIGLAWLGAWAFHYVSWPAARALDGVGRVYPGLLSGALRWRWLVTAGAAAAFVGSLSAVQHVGTNLVPDLAQGEFAFRIRLPEGTPLATTAQVVHQLEAPLLQDPRFARVFALVGSLPSTASGRRTHGENLAQINFVLPPGAGRDAERAAQARVREVLAAFPTLEAELVQPQVLTLEPPVVVQVFAEDLKILDRAAEAVAAELKLQPLLSDVTTSAEPGSPEIRVELDRERAASLRLDAEQVARSLRRQVRGQVVGRFRQEERRIDIRLRASERFRRRAEDVAALRVRLPLGGADAPDGVVLPVSAVAKVAIDRGPAALHHASGARVARITASSSAADLGAALAQVKTALAGLELPVGAVAELGGQDEELQESFGSLRLALALAIFLVFVVMAIQFESLRHPFVILLSVPMGLVGVVGALLLTQTPLGVLVFIGGVMLAGIVVNNAIVLVDAVNRRRRAGEELDAAIRGGGRERLRPILMTTTTTVLALLPMALGWGAGSELRAPLANTVIGGLTGATLLTLLVIPCVYRILAAARPPAEPAP